MSRGERDMLTGLSKATFSSATSYTACGCIVPTMTTSDVSTSLSLSKSYIATLTKVGPTRNLDLHARGLAGLESFVAVASGLIRARSSASMQRSYSAASSEGLLPNKHEAGPSSAQVRWPSYSYDVYYAASSQQHIRFRQQQA